MCYAYVVISETRNHIELYGNITWKQNNTKWTQIRMKQKQFMVSGVGDLTFTGLVFSWFLNNWEKKGSRTGVTITCCTKLWPSYCTSSGVRITIPNPTNLCCSPDLTSNPTREPPANSHLQSIQWKDQPSLHHTMTHTTNTSKKAMDNPASTEEETNTEEGAAATPPGKEIPPNQVPHSPFPYSGMTVPYVEGPKMDWTIGDALHSRFIR